MNDAKNAKTMGTLLIFVILGSIVAGYVAGFSVYRDYREKTAYFDRQVQITLDKFMEMQDNMNGLYTSLENTVDKNNIAREELVSKLEAIKGDIREWEREQHDAVVELKEAMDGLKVDKLARMVENLQGDVNGFKLKIQDLELKIDDKKESAVKVDLGKISVGKRETDKVKR